MEDGVDNSLPPGNLEDEEGDRQSKINISDVIEVIQTTDPSFQAAVQEMGDRMFGGGVVLGSGPSQRPQTNEQPAVVAPYVKIIEQPASKALRFRYECEGRSAGSIPGVHSTPENKTYPTIEIVGYKGRAVVVVSCVTKDQPYRPHPHNLVGKDGCKKGVCTVEINSPTMTVSFSNLGIQCVKKKEIDEALRVREEIRVDPFKTGFAYRSQATSIDLNAVRLCFQVFLEKNGQIRSPLVPVVSDIIYDKKAMSDLVICKMSHCSATVEGGLEVIILCEKVTKEDISIRFFEEQDNKVVWEAQGEFVHANVHKQVAISFRTPKYRSQDIETSVKASIQLRRPSDGATSEAHPFELRPRDSGRPGFLRKRNAELSILSRILAEEANKRASVTTDGNNNDATAVAIVPTISITDDMNKENISNESPATNLNGEGQIFINDDNHAASVNVSDSVSNGNIGEDLRESLTSDTSTIENDVLNGLTNGSCHNDRSLNELLDQVAELDEIYSENQTRLENLADLDASQDMEVDLEDFDDSNTYTSLQLAFKNPVSIAEPDNFSYEDVMTVRGPIIDLVPLKRDPDEEKLPPLPPKRVRKAPSMEGLRPHIASVPQGSVENILKPGKSLQLSRTPSQSQQALGSTHSEPPLPPTPAKKRSFLSRLFNRKPKKDKSPARTPERQLRPVGRSVSSVSDQRPSKFRQAVSHTSLKGSTGNLSLGTTVRYADSITHISLHADDRAPSQTSLKRPASLAPLPPTDGDTILVAENVLAIDASALKKLQDNLDLTEAEHYALYMAIAPHATASEFDETSCYYSPVEGGKFPLMAPDSKS